MYSVWLLQLPGLDEMLLPGLWRMGKIFNSPVAYGSNLRTVPTVVFFKHHMQEYNQKII